MLKSNYYLCRRFTDVKIQLLFVWLEDVKIQLLIKSAVKDVKINYYVCG